MSDTKNIPEEIAQKIAELKSMYYSKGSIIRSISKESGGKQQAKEYVERAFTAEKIYFAENKPELRAIAMLEMKRGVVFLLVTIVVGIVFGDTLRVLIWVPLAGLTYIVFGIVKYLKSR